MTTATTDASVTWLHQPVPIASVQGTLALDLTPVLDPPTVTVEPGGPGSDVTPVPAALRGGLEQWVGRYVQAVAEIAAGERPPSQLARWTRKDVHHDLTRRAALVARAAGRPGRPRRRAGARAQVAAVRVSFLDERTAEACARVRHGQRSRAVALRLEHVRGRWLCTALELG